MQCSHCRTENEDSAKFCASCGAPMQVAPPPVCPVCAHVNAAGANFCIACGAHLRRRRVPPEAARAATTASNSPGADAATARMAAAAPATPGRAPASNPSPERTRIPPDLGAMRRPEPAAAATPRHEDFEGAAIRPPRISGFELKAGLAVLVLVLGGGLLWWSNQNDSRLAELALTAATPASSALRTVAETALGSAPPAQERPVESAVPVAPPMPPVATVAPAAPVPVTVPDATPKASEAPPPAKARAAGSKHKARPKREREPEHAPAPAPVKELPPVVELSEPASTPVEQARARADRRRSVLREQIASCRRLSLFEGERCLWRLCDGKWGKDGCPSYN